MTPVSSNSQTPPLPSNPPLNPSQTIPPPFQTSTLTPATADQPESSNCCDIARQHLYGLILCIRKGIASALSCLGSTLTSFANWVNGSSDPQNVSISLHNNSNIPPSRILPPNNPGVSQSAIQDRFITLTITEIECNKIYDLIHTLGGGLLPLATQQDRLKKIGDEIQNVHPLKFLEYIFNTPQLVQDVQTMYDYPIPFFLPAPWQKFIEGLSGKFTRNATELPQLVAGFAKSLRINLQDIQPYFDRAQWEDLVKFLMDVKLGRRSSVWVEPTPPQEMPPEGTSTPEAPQTHLQQLTEPLVQQQFSIERLAFNDQDTKCLTNLIQTYAQNNRFWLLWNAEGLNKEWELLSLRHPLKILAHLYSSPPLMGQLKTILETWGRHGAFMEPLKYHFSRQSFHDIEPYLDDFTKVCKLRPNHIKQLAENQRWDEIVKELFKSYVG